MNKPLFPQDFAVATVHPAPRLSWAERGNNALWLVGALWLECVIVWLVWHWGSFATLDFRDPDDAMRLVQVRDFLAGQSWFDVSQHRVSPPEGGPMHWSRLLDLPIAGIIVVLRPIAGQAIAEIVACVTVPVVTLGILCLGLFGSLRNFLGTHSALLTVALLVTSFPVLVQFAPLRIDHHGWQAAMAAFAMGGVIAPDPRRGGWIAGAAMALWLHISGEGLPFAVIVGTVLALRYAARADEWPRLIRYVAMLTFGSAALLLLTHGWPGSFAPHCDSMSPPYLLPLLLLLPAMLTGRLAAGDGTIVRRMAPVALAGLGAAALFVMASPQCLAGPFQTLDPVVYQYWYLGVMEGQPFWQQGATTASIIVVPPLVGIIGLGAAMLSEKDPHKRMQWLSLLGLAIGSFAISLLVLRAMSVAHLLSLAGSAWIIAHLYRKIRKLPAMPARVAATTSLCLLSPAGLAIGASSAAAAIVNEPAADPDTALACSGAQEVAALSRLPAAILFAPIDLGPAILQRTGHSVVATAHHRNVAGIGKVIRANIAPPDAARRIITASGARYYVYCPGLNEVKRYGKIAPDGLASRIGSGHAPDWLRPVPMTGLGGMTLYEISR